jgi:hypothetical protein
MLFFHGALCADSGEAARAIFGLPLFKVAHYRTNAVSDRAYTPTRTFAPLLPAARENRRGIIQAIALLARARYAEAPKRTKGRAVPRAFRWAPVKSGAGQTRSR